MNANANSGQETVDEQRAQYERFRFVVLEGDGGGYVNVENRSYGDESGDHIYSVQVQDGESVGCSCPHHVHRDAHCKHMVAVEDHSLVRSSATCAASTQAPRVATDGSGETDETHESDGDTESHETAHCRLCDSPIMDSSDRNAAGELCVICDCRAERNHPWSSPAEATDDTGREEPTRSEPADFGGGEGGIDQL